MKLQLLKSMIDFISDNQLLEAKDYLLVGVSGGVDSIVLVDLLQSASFRMAIAHVNYNLRADESDKDGLFVQSFAKEKGIPYFQLDVDTAAYAKENKMSIQEAARNIRYDWFEEKRKEIGADWIVVAHHKNDIAETMLFNLARGSGIAGLHGIKSKNGYVIRPLLFAERKDVIAYAKNKNLVWREDLSNADRKYARNLIRHEVLPKLQEVNPQVVEHLAKTANVLSEVELLIDSYLTSLRIDICGEEAGQFTFSLTKIKSLPAANYILYALVKEYGFNAAQVQDMLTTNTSGKVFLSNQKRAVIHGNKLLITGFAEDAETQYLLESWSDFGIQTPEFSLSWVLKEYHGETLPQHEETNWIDASQLIFPLILRKRKAGDRFYPLGMKGKSKKVKDFLTDLKLSLPEKEKIWLLVSADGKIVWIVGLRLDERFKVFGRTKKILEIKQKSLFI